MKRNWKKYNKSLVRRGEIMLSFDAMEHWDEELRSMNHKKEGNRFVYPESFMEALGVCTSVFGIAIQTNRRSDKISSAIQSKNTHVFGNLEKSKQS